MQQVVFLLLIGLVLIQADSLLEMDAHCAEECGSPEYDELVKELDHQDEVLNDLVTRAVNVEHSLDQSKKEHDDADRESRNLLLRLDRLHSDKEHDVCPKKHRKCLTSAARDGKPCVANILVCDGEEDCLDGSDEDPELCKIPMALGEKWYGRWLYFYCTFTEPVDIYEYVYIEYVQRPDAFKSMAKMSLIGYWKVENEVRSINLWLNYYFSDKTSKAQYSYRGYGLVAEYFFTNDLHTIVVTSAGTGKTCAEAVFTPKADEDVIRMIKGHTELL